MVPRPTDESHRLSGKSIEPTCVLTSHYIQMSEVSENCIIEKKIAALAIRPSFFFFFQLGAPY
jgi:hypothetical protein